MSVSAETQAPRFQQPDATGHFGPYGGVFVPETLMTALQELAAAYDVAKKDPAFQAELRHHLKEFAGRPTEADQENVRYIASKLGATYVDLFPLMMKQAADKKIADDGLHPSAKAHAEWAQALLEKF